MSARIPSGWLKFLIGWTAVFLFRFILLPLRAPNVEPLLATLMPFSKRYGALGGFLFAFLGIVLYDSVTSGLGIWTAVTALAYGGIGVGSYYYFRNREATRLNFVTYGVFATLAYDAVTGLTVGPMAFGQPLSAALAGQIPFTILHLLGTVVFSAVLSPAIYRWVVKNEALEFSLTLSTSSAPRA